MNYITNINDSNKDEATELPYIIDLNNPNNGDEATELPYIIHAKKQLEIKEKINFSEKVEKIAENLGITYEKNIEPYSTIYKYFVFENGKFEDFLEEELNIKDVTKLSDEEIKGILIGLVDTGKEMIKKGETFTSIYPETIKDLISDIKWKYSGAEYL